MLKSWKNNTAYTKEISNVELLSDLPRTDSVSFIFQVEVELVENEKPVVPLYLEQK